MLNKFVNSSNEFLKLTGSFLNGLIVFLTTTLGNIGKLLSTAVIIFTMYLIYKAFFGQIENIIPFPDVSKISGDDLAKALELRRAVYKGAIESIAAPLATLCGTVVSVIGIGITVQKYLKDKNNNGVEDSKETAVEPQQPPEISGQNSEIKY